jgi:A/G-specific adenine glycosylase
MALARDAHTAVSAAGIADAWPDDAQRDRCLVSLLADGLLVRREDSYALPD